MSRHIIPLSPEQLTAFELETFVTHATALHQQHREAFTAPVPKAPRRWLSHYAFTPRPVTLTPQGNIEGGLSWLVGATMDFSFTRALCAPHYDTRGGPCYDPASLVFLEVAAKVEHYVDYARFWDDLHQADKGRRSRQLAGRHDHIPGPDDLCHFRSRIGDDVIHQTMAIVVELFRTFGLIPGALLSTAGQLEPSYARYTGCPYACAAWRQFPVDEAGHQELRRQVQSGARRLQLICPFPEVVATVRAATATKGPPPNSHNGADRERGRPPRSGNADRHQVAALLGLPLPEDQVPSWRLKWGHVSQGPQGQLLASWPKGPADLEAQVGDHVDNKNPSKKESVFGDVHLKTTDLNRELGLELPLGHSTSPANAHEGPHFLAHRATLPLPVLPGHVQVGDAAYDGTVNYEKLRDRGGIAVCNSKRRNEDLSLEALGARGYDHHGTPYAPCGRLCRSHGYDYQADSRQYVCGRPCSPTEQQRCPHGYGVRG